MHGTIFLYLAKIIASVIFLVIFFSGSISSMKCLKNIRVIYASKKILIVNAKLSFRILYFVIIGVLFIISAFNQDNLISKLLFILFGILIFINPIRDIIESTMSGIYINGVIINSYSAKWENIEKYKRLKNGIRFIHKENGAFDIFIDDQDIDEIEELLKSKRIVEL
jgi:hypothetical protein